LQEFNENHSISEVESVCHDSDFNVFTPQGQGTNRQSSKESIKFDPLPEPPTLGGNVATLRPRIAPLNKERLGTEALQGRIIIKFHPCSLLIKHSMNSVLLNAFPNVLI
jgi:hypothetical protein